MLTSSQCLLKYGQPRDPAPWLTVFHVPDYLRFGPVPKKIYCNQIIAVPLQTALSNIVARGLQKELKTWDGCFNIRPMRTSTNFSLHSWGLAIDVNAKENPMGKIPMLSAEFVACWTDAGFDWGGDWQRPDGMHFQLRKL